MFGITTDFKAFNLQVNKKVLYFFTKFKQINVICIYIHIINLNKFDSII